MCAEYWDDPFRFTLECFPWGEEGPLADDDGPDAWQEKVLRDVGASVRRNRFDGSHPVDPLQFAIASGHGIGKSTLFAWLFWWIMCTRPSKIRVTANTYTQLETTTWAEITRWWKLLIFKDIFEVTGSKAYHKENKEGWFGVPITCAEENSEAFAGQHFKDGTSAFFFDESSLIPDKIFEVASAGLTDGEPMWFCAGNPTRNTGEFYEICFGEKSHRWDVRSIDARTAKFPNKKEQQRWIEDHGIESDYVRTRILGLPPKTAEDQLIGKDLVDSARSRDIEPLDDDPLVVGVDVPDGGSAYFSVTFRRGLTARPGPLVPATIRLPGSRCDRASMVGIMANILGERAPSKKVSMMFVDSQPGAVLVERLRNLGYINVQEVSFGDKSPDKLYANMRAYMWGKEMRDWLAKGCIDPGDAILRKQLSYPGFHRRVGGDGALVVESKEEMRDRGLESPDFADSLALTFAAPVILDKRFNGEEYRTPRSQKSSGDNWMRY
jgi:hypothetical protein